MTKKAWGLLMLLLAASLTGLAQGRPQPLHGGIVRVVGTKSFELVAKPDGAELYVTDAGQEIVSATMSVTLLVESGGVTSEIIMLAAGGNKFITKEARFSRGARATVLLIAPDRSKTTARFVVK